MTTAREKITYCLANLAAVLSALYIAFWLNLDRPYWAMFSVFIVSRPISGAVRAKGVYRFFGTLVGASMSVFLVPPLVQAPVLLSLAVSLWVGLCLFLALQDRTPRSYAFLLAGYSVGIVGLSTVNAPTTVFDVAVARLEEIAIGIGCATLAHTIFFPRNFGDVLRTKAEEAIRHAAQVANKAIGPHPVPPSTSEIATLATAVTDLDTLYSQIGHETSNVPRLPGVMVALLDRLATTLPRASLICRSIEALKGEGPLTAGIQSTLNDASAALASLAGGDMPAYSSLAGGKALAPTPSDEEISVEARTLGALVVRQATALTLGLVESRTLAAALNAAGSAQSVATLVSDEPMPPFYRDEALALLSAASATAATLVACGIWIEASWPEGFVAAQFAAIGCSLFATLDAPSKTLFSAILGIMVALPLAAVYAFAILPGLDGFPSLALALTPAMLLFSYLQTFERLEGAALVLSIGFAGALALQESYASDFASFVNSNVAEIIGLLIAAAMLLVFRTINPVWLARRILRSGWAVIRELTDSRSRLLNAWVLPMFNRAGQAAVRLAARDHDAPKEDVLLALRIGLNVADLRCCRESDGRIDDALSELANLYPYRRGSTDDSRRRSRRHLCARFAQIATALARLPVSEETMQGMTAAMGIRLDLDSHFCARGAKP